MSGEQGALVERCMFGSTLFAAISWSDIDTYFSIGASVVAITLGVLGIISWFKRKRGGSTP